MAIEAISSSAGVAASRPPDPPPDVRAAAAASQEVSPRTDPGPAPAAPVAIVNDPEGSIQQAQTIIQGASSDLTPSSADMQRAADAYRAVSTSESDLARQRQAQGARSTDVLA